MHSELNSLMVYHMIIGVSHQYLSLSVNSVKLVLNVP